MQTRSLRAFLANLFDYAGLFPPANLTLDSAIRQYASYQSGQDAWMLGRFIIPAARLKELDPYLTIFSDKIPLSGAALGRKSVNAATCLEGLRSDLAEIQSFGERFGDAGEIGVLELPLPPSSPEDQLLEAISSESYRHGLDVFCEVTVPLHENWERQMMTTLDAITSHNFTKGIILGLKLRTGGLTDDAFPTPAQVASVLIGCRDRKIPLKFTAGLHHPIRMYRDEVKTRMHGFLNVFTAGMIAHEHNATETMIEQILSDETPSSFSITTDGLAWKDQKISASDIERLRATALRSYGTCSFDEPRDDLKALIIL